MSAAEVLHIEAVLAGIGTLVFHIASSTILQFWFYHHKQSDASQWKIQPKRNESFAEAQRWWLPLLRLKQRHKPMHWLYATVNLLIAATAAMVTAELTIRDRLPLKLTDGPIVMPLIWSTLFQCTAEYHWHRALHQPFMYRLWHKIHHAYQSPEPFDDFFINPIEGALYQFILWGPAYLFQQSLPAFALYMAIHGFCGIADHCGIRVRLPYVYDSAFHDAHHRLFNANYGFPWTFWDKIYGTFRE